MCDMCVTFPLLPTDITKTLHMSSTLMALHTTVTHCSGSASYLTALGQAVLAPSGEKSQLLQTRMHNEIQPYLCNLHAISHMLDVCGLAIPVAIMASLCRQAC